MKIEFEVTYNAQKLEDNIKDIIKETVNSLGNSFVEGSKKAIEKGNFQPISEFTKMIRQNGYSPNAGKKKTSSVKPLQHTGRLLKGIKQLKNGDMSVHKYGLYHLPDDIFDLSEESVVSQVSATKKAKSGTAYKIVKNNFTLEYPHIIGKNVPIRNWFQMDKKLATKAISRFHKLISKNFVGKKWELFRLYG